MPQHGGAICVNDLLSTLSHTPLPTILMVAGIMFWILAIAGSVAGKISVEPGKQRTAGLVGTGFIALGLVLFFAPDPATKSTEKTETTKITQTPPVAQTPVQTPSTPVQPPAPLPIPIPTTGPVSVEKKADITASAKSDTTSARPSAGVNCTGTGTPDEIKICGSAKLSELDWQLSGAYQAASKKLNKNQRAKLASDENAWLKKRGDCQSDEQCLTAVYRSRIDQLQLAQ